jgi:hypothetical protein
MARVSGGLIIAAANPHFQPAHAFSRGGAPIFWKRSTSRNPHLYDAVTYIFQAMGFLSHDLARPQIANGGGGLRIRRIPAYLTSSLGQPTRSDPPSWGLGVRLAQNRAQ